MELSSFKTHSWNLTVDDDMVLLDSMEVVSLSQSHARLWREKELKFIEKMYISLYSDLSVEQVNQPCSLWLEIVRFLFRIKLIFIT